MNPPPSHLPQLYKFIAVHEREVMFAKQKRRNLSKGGSKKVMGRSMVWGYPPGVDIKSPKEDTTREDGIFGPVQNKKKCW